MRISNLLARCVAKVAGICAARDATRRAVFSERNKSAILNELQKLVSEAESGDVQAIYDLGMAYRNRIPEIEIERQAETAFDLISKAAKLGHLDAQHRLALMYWRGEGAKKSKADALAWCWIAGEEPRDITGDKSAWVPQMSILEIQEANQLLSALGKLLPVMQTATVNSELVAVGRSLKKI